MSTASAIAWPEVMQAFGTLIGSIGVVAALAYTARQTRSIGNQARLQLEEAERDTDLQQANLELRLMELTIAIDKLFLDDPWLRPYFYEDRDLAWWSSGRRRAQVLSVAEVLIDFTDAIAGLRRHGQMSDRDYRNWKTFTESYYRNSPAIRVVWERWGEFFLPETADLFMGLNGADSSHFDPAPADAPRGLWRTLRRRAGSRPPGFMPPAGN